MQKVPREHAIPRMRIKYKTCHEKIGFKWKKTETNRKLLMEKHDIRLLRVEFFYKAHIRVVPLGCLGKL